MAMFYAWGGKGINIELCRILASHPNLSSRCQLLQTKRMIDKWSCWTTTAMLKIKLCYLGRVHLDNNPTIAGQLLDNGAKIGTMGRRQVLLWFWQTWLTPNMSTAILPTNLFPPFSNNTFTLSLSCHPQVVVWQTRAQWVNNGEN